MPTLEFQFKAIGADDVADALKTLGSNAKDAGSNLDTAGSKVTSTTTKLKDFKTSLSGVVGSFTAISAGVIGIVRDFTQLEQSQVRLDQANKRLTDSQNKLESAQRKYNDAVAKYGENSQQAQDALKKVESATKGVDVAQQRQSLQQQKVNEGFAEFASDIMPNVISVFGSVVSAISLFTQKGENGVSLAGKLKTSFTDLISPAKEAGTSMGTLGTAIVGVGLALAALETGIVAVQQISGAINAFSDSAKGDFHAVANDFNGMITSLEQIPVAGIFLKMADDMGILPKVSDAQAKEVVRIWSSIGAQIQAGFSSLVSNLQFVWNGIQSAIAQVPGWVQTNIINPLVAIPGQLQALGSQIYQKIISGWNSLVTWVQQNVLTPIQNIPNEIQALGSQIYQKIISGWTSLVGWVQQNITNVVKAAPTNIGDLGKQIYDKVVAGWQILTQWVTDNIVNPIKNAPAAIGALGKTIYNKIIEGWTELTDWVKTHITEPIQKFADGLQAKGAEIWNKLSQGWTDLQNWVTEHIVNPLVGFIDNVKAVGDQIWQKLSQGWQDLTGWIQDNIIKPFSEIPQNLPDIGNQIWQKILGASDAVQKGVNALSDALKKGDLKGALELITKNLDGMRGATDAAGAATGDAAAKVSKFEEENKKLAAALGELNAALHSGKGMQDLWNQGLLQQETNLAQAEAKLQSSKAALDEYNRQLQQSGTYLTAFGQGQVDMATHLNDSVAKLGEAQGKLKDFAAELGTVQGQQKEFNAGAAAGIDDVLKWADNLAQASGKAAGMRQALDALLPALKVDFPQGVNLSNKAMMDFAEAVTKGSDAVTKTLQDADKQWASILDNFNKAVEQAPKDQQKAWDELKKAQKSAYDELQKALQSHTGNQQQAWNTYYQKIREAQDKFSTDSKSAWTKYFQDLNDTLSRPLTAGEQALVQSMARMDEDLKKGIATLNQDLEGMKLGLPESAFNMQRDFNNLITKLRTDLQSLPPQAQSSYGALIDAVNRLPVHTQEDWNNKVSALKVIYNAVNGPAQSFADVSNNVKGALEGVVKVNADGSISRVGQASSGAKSGVDGLGNAMTTLTSNTGFAASALESLKTQWLDPLTKTTLTIKLTADTGSAASALSSLKSQFVDPMTGKTLTIKATADTGAAASALSALTSQFITPLKTPITIQVTANTGAAASALSALLTQFVTPLKTPITIQVTANTGPAASALSTLNTSFIAPLKQPIIITPQANTGPATSALQQLIAVENQVRQAITITPQANTGAATSALQQLINVENQVRQPITITPQANTGFATSALQQLLNVEAQVKAPITIQVSANTQQASQALSALQAQLNALRQPVNIAPQYGYSPYGYAARGGSFTFGPSGFSRLSYETEPLYAQGGGTFGSPPLSDPNALLNYFFSLGGGGGGGIGGGGPVNIDMSPGSNPTIPADIARITATRSDITAPGSDINANTLPSVIAPNSTMGPFSNATINVPGGSGVPIPTPTPTPTPTPSPGTGGGGGIPLYGFGPGGSAGGAFGGAPPSAYGFPTFGLARGGQVQYAARGGTFVVSKPTKIGNLTVGEGFKPELLVWRPGRNARVRGGGILTVIPFSKLGAQSGGNFPVFGSAPGPGLFPGLPFNPDPNYNPNPSIIEYGGIPVPVQGQGGVPVTQPGQYGAPNLSSPTGLLTGGFGGGLPTFTPPTQQAATTNQINNAVQQIADNTSNLPQNPFSPSQIGSALADEIIPTLQQSHDEVQSLITLIRKLLSKMMHQDMNTNLVIDGQKIASAITKYMGANAYGGM